MRDGARRGAAALLLLTLAPVLVSCAAGSAGQTGSAGPGLGSSRAALDALTSLGIDCTDFTVDEIAAVPFTQIRCPGLGIDWFADVRPYEAVVADDCAAVPVERRAGLAGIVIVTGPDFVLRGNGEADINAWPARVDPARAAAVMAGTVRSAADYCTSLGAWK
jgi:hypothetical protein